MNEDQSGGDTGITGSYEVDFDARLQNHSDGFSKALENALEMAAKEKKILPDKEYDSVVRHSIVIKYTNPPWVGDYKVWIDPKERP